MSALKCPVCEAPLPITNLQSSLGFNCAQCGARLRVPYETMAALARFAVDAVRNGKAEQAHATVEFLEEVLRSPRLHPEIPNAVAISFVDPAELRTFEADREFLDALPAAVRELLE